MSTNSLADLLARLRMGAQTRKRSIRVVNTAMAFNLLTQFYRRNQIMGFTVTPNSKEIEVFLRPGAGANTGPLGRISLVSKPGRRVYLSFRALTNRYKKAGEVLISTPSGLLSHRVILGERLRQFRLAGEPLIHIRS